MSYITFREKTGKGLEYRILGRQFPHYEACIYANRGPLPFFCHIPGYALYVVMIGTLRGASIPGYQDVAKEIESVLLDMAQWYLTNIIETNPEKFKKFKTQSNVPASL